MYTRPILILGNCSNKQKSVNLKNTMHKHFLILICGIFLLKDSNAQSLEKANNYLRKYVWSQNSNQEESNKHSKKTLDFHSIDEWMTIGRNEFVMASNDGKYFTYRYGFVNRSSRSPGNQILVLQSLKDNNKKIEIADAVPLFFSKDNSKLIYKKSDSAFVCELRYPSFKQKFIARCSETRLSTEANGDLMLFIFKNKDATKSITIYNALTEKTRKIDSISDYYLSNHGNTLVIKKEHLDRHKRILELVTYNTKKGNAFLFWCDSSQNSKVSNLTMDQSGNSIAFQTQTQKDGYQTNRIIFYNNNTPKTICLVDDERLYAENELSITGPISITQNGQYVLFQFEKTRKKDSTSDVVPVDIWSYTDTIIQSTQLLRKQPEIYPAIVSIDNKKIIKLKGDNQNLMMYNEQCAVIENDYFGDKYWLRYKTEKKYWIIDYKSGTKKELASGRNLQNFTFSRNGKYVLYFNPDSACNFFSYDIDKQELKNITKSAPPYIFGSKAYFDKSSTLPTYPIGIAGWLDTEQSVLIYDNFDIWRVDLQGKVEPKNITNGYGRKTNTTLRFAGNLTPISLNLAQSVLLKGFNVITKYNGFLQTAIKENTNPIELYMGPYFFDAFGVSMLPINAQNFDKQAGMQPIKIGNSNNYIVKRQTANNSPNYYLSKGLKTFKQLTNFNSNSEYNWLTTELINFKQLDGTTCQGILYKPENFDSTKKYPVVINYYEQYSHRLYQYPNPDLVASGNFDIPWLVNRGYLVFTPDIYAPIRLGNTAALNSICGSAEHLSKLTFVDSNRLAICGHSAGGGYTNFILTHTNRFAAVMEGAGVSDRIGDALSLSGKEFYEISRLELFEIDGKSIWENLYRWVEESPIMQINKIQSPLLIFHCKEDAGVPWSNALALYISLRRQEKRVWMLQYDKEGHSLLNSKNKYDLTIRATQFFDHYLLRAPIPKWMKEGVPAYLKGKDPKYDLSF